MLAEILIEKKKLFGYIVIAPLVNAIVRGKGTVGISTLEEKFQTIIHHLGTEVFQFSSLINRASHIQQEMRKILDELTPHHCGPCENKCCEGLPLEGWFSLEDYVLFRVKYGKPLPPANRIQRDTACYFLTSCGCSLPEDMRPFTCVKINCETLTESIKAISKITHFNQLKSALEDIHQEVSSLIEGNHLLPSPTSHGQHHLPKHRNL